MIGEASGDARPLDAVAAWLEDERSRWFYWFPVFLGLGIALYFWLPEEPRLAAALAPLPVALALRAVAGRGTLPSVLIAVLFVTAATSASYAAAFVAVNFSSMRPSDAIALTELPPVRFVIW